MMKRAFVVAAITVCAFCSIAFAQGKREDELWICCGTQTVTPGRPIVVAFHTVSGEERPVRVRVYRISVATMASMSRITEYGGSVAGAVPGTLVWEGDAQGTQAEQDARVVSVGPFPIGLYYVEGTLGTARTGVPANVTTLGLVSIGGAGGSALWAVDLRTFRSHAGPTTIVLRNTHASREVRCGFDGIVTVPAPIPEDTVYIASSRDGSVDVENFWNGDDSTTPASVVFVQTDRPVYRPGQTVYFHAILRSGYESAYGIPRGAHRVQIEDQDGTTIYDRKLTTSPFGTLSGEVRLPYTGLGGYNIQIDGQDRQSFYVEAYKKPEYLIDVRPRADAIVGGEAASVDVHAAYFFGRPAAAMHLHYRVQPEWYVVDGYTPYRNYSRERDRGELDAVAGDASTDSRGDAAILVPTQHADFPYYLTVEVHARDNSGRTIGKSSSVLVYPAAVKLSLIPQEWFSTAGRDVTMDLRSTDLNDKPVRNQRVRLTFARSVWDSGRRDFVEKNVETRVVETGADGSAAVRWQAQQAGSYRILAQTSDTLGRVSSAQQYLWVIGGDESWLPPSERPVLVPSREMLGANERPRVLVRMPAPGRDVVLAVSSDHLVSARLVHVTGYAASITLDAPKNATVFTVEAVLPTEEGVAVTDVAFHRKAPKQLHITIASDRKQYEPGQAASFEARVTDSSGKPVQTELSLDVVDDAVYAVQADLTADPVDRFYGNSGYLRAEAHWYRPNRLLTVAKVVSRAAAPLVRPGMTADAFSVQGVTVRKNFADTAYWTPAVITDKRGRARIAFTWPDNLTTWRTTAVGVTADASVGSARRETLVTKDFLVRLEMPRFLRAGDRSTIVGIAQGKADAPNVRLSFLPDALDPLTDLLRLDANQSATASWPFDAGSVLGARTLELSGSDGVRSDAMQLALPIESAGAAEHVRDAGELPQLDSLAVSLPAGYEAGTLRLTLTPSVAAQLLQNVRLLDVYPYDCTEQTMSAALPAVFVDRLFRRSGLDMPADVIPEQVVTHAIERLRELQHTDGSWGWWEHDAAHPYMTAYAVYGLAEFKKAGYRGTDLLLLNGIDSLRQQVRAANTDTLRFWGGAQRGSEWNTRAFMLFALADADPSSVEPDILAQTLAHAHSLNSYALAVLGLAYHELHEDRVAKRLLEMLNARAVTNGPYTYWAGDTWHYAWEDDPIETTAYALRLNAAVEPGSAVALRAIAFLRSQQRGSWWFTTKDTAASIYAIAEAERPTASEFHPDETVTVFAGDRTVKTLRIASPVLDAADAEVDVPAGLLQNGSTVRIVRTGRGALYWSSDFVRYAPWTVHQVRDSGRSIFARLFPAQPPLRIERRYTAGHPGPWRVGDLVHVEVTVTARDDVQYVAIEDPFPAGVEYAPAQGEAGSSNWSGVQFFDDRAVFFADTIARRWPLHLSYDLRVTTDGRYSAPAPTAYAMYGPPVSATGTGENVIVQQ